MAGDALPPGTMVDGYELLRVVGRGGFGITYEARHPKHRLNVAVKEFMPSAVGASRDGHRITFDLVSRSLVERTLAKFEASAAQLRGFSHPNIVRVHDYVRANGTAYVVMELVRGRSLSAVLEERGSLTPDGLRYVLEPVLDALEQVHKAGFVHRDVAPDNIMLREDGGPILIDFGALSTRFDVEISRAATGTDGLVKRHYTAPEQIASKVRPDARTDVYSCAAVAYRALVGEHPADALDRTAAIANQDGRDPYEPMAGMAITGVDQRMAAAIDAGLAYRSAQRTPGIAELRWTFGWDSRVMVPTGYPPSPEAVEPKMGGSIEKPRLVGLALACFILLIPVMGVKAYVQWQDGIAQARAKQEATKLESILLGGGSHPEGTGTGIPHPEVPPTRESGLPGESSGDRGQETNLNTPAWPPKVDEAAFYDAALRALPAQEPLSDEEAEFIMEMVERAVAASVADGERQREEHVVSHLAKVNSAIAMLRRLGRGDEANQLGGAFSWNQHHPHEVVTRLAAVAAAIAKGDIDIAEVWETRAGIEVAVRRARDRLSDGDARGYVEQLGAIVPDDDDIAVYELTDELVQLASVLDGRGEDQHAMTVAAVIAATGGRENMWGPMYDVAHLLLRLPEAETRYGFDEWEIAVLNMESLKNRAAGGDGLAALREARTMGEGPQRENAIASVAIGMARAGDHDAARSAVMETPAGALRWGYMVSLAKAQMELGELSEARTSALLALEFMESSDTRLNIGAQLCCLPQVLTRVGLLEESAALTSRYREEYGDSIHPGYEIEIALALR